MLKKSKFIIINNNTIETERQKTPNIKIIRTNTQIKNHMQLKSDETQKKTNKYTQIKLFTIKQMLIAK